MYLFLERGIRGGLAVCVKKHAVSNKPYIPETYNRDLPHKYIMYLDANNLYGWAMSKCLPHSRFRWVEENMRDIILTSLHQIPDDGLVGFIFEVDVEYPENLHEYHNDLPFLPQTKIPPCLKQSKLIASVENKKHYICHYVTLKQAMQEGLQIIKVHRILQFQQRPWLKGYIDLNTTNRQKATNDFDKNLFK